MTQNQPRQHDDDVEPKDEMPDEQVAAPAEDEAPPAEGDRLAELEAELAETKDRMLRAMADTENMRRRAARDTDEARKYAVTGFARELLEVADNLGRALESVPAEAREQEQVKPLFEGVELTRKSLAACFERFKITTVAPEIGDRFDHNQHQAMFETETADHAPGSIIQVMQNGYMIADRLLRPAMVGVSKKPAAAAPPPAEDDEQRGQTLDTSA